MITSYIDMDIRSVGYLIPGVGDMRDRFFRTNGGET